MYNSFFSRILKLSESNYTLSHLEFLFAARCCDVKSLLIKRDWKVDKIRNLGKSGYSENMVGYQLSRTEALNNGSANLVLI